MEREKIDSLKNKFDNIIHKTEENFEFWNARELQELLGYKRWENFETTINRAITSCKTTGIEPLDHFREVTKMICLAKGAKRKIVDIMLTRYACYLIAQNGDTKKEEIAFAQSYFAIQTRKQELIEDRMKLLARMDARDQLRESEKQLSQNIYERGVDDAGFARVRSNGDKALFGGFATADMKGKLDVSDNRALADFLPTLTIAAKNLANEMTNHNIVHDDLFGETLITDEHIQNNTSVRNMLGKRGIKPELLPADEDIKKLERRVKSEERKLAKEAGNLPKNIEDKGRFDNEKSENE
jgi:DNA-damage-inducible protein D